ncbi:class I SAM-dependent methyltransferase [Geomonas propionica]|uniref:Methyltransferase n=1 Tax=Geomonas propionica TaxID=2798582 RepID=A0ABS0YMP4_9BACT|nr:hypothetical protein [Geomonas propionica]MBJ6799246.1 hypothetical protein [Geomonas propionica]
MTFFRHIWRSIRLGRLQPVSRSFGFDRGQPIDRYYIERFLSDNSLDIKGRVLEVGDGEYTRVFGAERVTKSDVLHAQPGNPEATLVGNLATGEGIPDLSFDCMILTQTFPFIYDLQAAVASTYLKLKEGGVLLATFAGISQISRYDMDRWGDFWRLSDVAARRLFGDVFGDQNVVVQSHGNVLVACSFLHGLASRELTRAELEYRDEDYQVLITVRAVKRARS